MALLDPTQLAAAQTPTLQSPAPAPQYASFGDFLKSPDALALGAGLLSGNSFHEGLATGVQNMQMQQGRTLDNQMKQMQNNQLNAHMDAAKKLHGIISPLLEKDPNNITAILADGAASAGDFKTAIDLLNGSGNEFTKPQAVLDEKGSPKLIQSDKRGNIKEVKGYLPARTSGQTLSVDPVSGAITFTQGATGMPIAAPADMEKNPMMSPARSGQGGTYENKKTGEIISTDTNRQTTNDQVAVAAIDRVAPQLNELTQTLPQFQWASTRGLTHVEQFLNDQFHTNFALPSVWARGKALLQSSPEGLIKAYQLNSTDQNAAMVRAIIEPEWGESPNQYKLRVDKSLRDMKMFEDQSKQRMAFGIQLQPPTNPAGGIPAIPTNPMSDNAIPMQTASQQTQTQAPPIQRYNRATGKFE